MKYGVLVNNSYNIGDDIQGVAAMRFLPQVDYYIFKENQKQFHSKEGEKVKTILNSWYMWKPENFPPSEDIIPLPISMHFASSCRDCLLNEKTIEYFKAVGPIGCRDIDTANWLQSNNIDAYFSGCLTLTLTENKKIRNNGWGNYILCVDVPPIVVDKIKSRAKGKNVFVLNKNIFSSFYATERLEISKMFLYMYHNADSVVTGNLHVSLPSLAFNTSVCLLNNVNNGPDVNARFSGIREWFNNYDVDTFLNNDVFDFKNPPANPGTHLDFRKKLEIKCTEFTGFDSKMPTLQDNYDPSFELLKILQFCHFNQKKNFKSLMASAPDELLKAYNMITLDNQDKHIINY